MTTSTTSRNSKRKIRLWAVLAWLLIWQLASMWIGQEILLVSPVTVVITLIRLAGGAQFWLSVASSMLRIIGGFLLAVVLGAALAGLSAALGRLREFLLPFVATVKSIPVASFVILVLIWVSSRNLSVLISFLMVFPVIYTNVLDGISQTDRGLLEMAELFGIPFGRRLRTIYVSQVLPYFRTGCSLALGLCWKAGVAAEVIGIPQNSIGENLYNAKIYLDTPALFAWTLVIICISVLFEKGFLRAVECLVQRLERLG
ncbi:ABC transporter permease [Mordavella massiliensis]|uniref:ABC transporter permease subunit n=1 Tax=Mordavella massiliensis TaxID=1871024 RepID=A0A939BHP1_9CLOT|nr:ABC transporter permease subunit [Mordavella massiliensis]MBM6949298.1 ABC transporter permease subunit [Mordavella massiliensis]